MSLSGDQGNGGKKRLINDARALLGTFLCLDNCSLLLFTVRCFWLIGFASYQFRMERLNADGRRRKTTSEFIHPDMIGACWGMLWMMSKFSARCRVSLDSFIVTRAKWMQLLSQAINASASFKTSWTHQFRNETKPSLHNDKPSWTINRTAMSTIAFSSTLY